MKTFVAALFTLILTIANAQSNLKIFSEDGKKFQVMIDGNLINSTFQNEVIASNLNVDQCKVNVIFEDNKTSAIVSEIALKQNYETTFRITLSKGNLKLKWISESPILMATSAAPTNTVSASQIPANACTPPNEKDFSKIKYNVQNQIDDSRKLNLSKLVSNTNCLSASQIREICDLFNNEETKLEFAKYAFKNCPDKQNYALVGSTFNFDSSIEELNAFTGQ